MFWRYDGVFAGLWAAPGTGAARLMRLFKGCSLLFFGDRNECVMNQLDILPLLARFCGQKSIKDGASSAIFFQQYRKF